MSEGGGGADWDRWRTKWKTSFWDDDTEDRQAGRQTQTLSTYWHCLVNVPVLLCIWLCVCTCVYANASGEIILCGLLYPRSVGTSLSFHRYRSPGTRKDRQADGETADHKQLSAEVLKPARSQWETYWSLFPSFSILQILTSKTPTWALAMIGNSVIDFRDKTTGK